MMNRFQMFLSISTRAATTRDLRTAISLALAKSEGHGGLVVAALTPPGVELQWAQNAVPPSSDAPFVPPQVEAEAFSIPLMLQ